MNSRDAQYNYIACLESSHCESDVVQYIVQFLEYVHLQNSV